MKFQTSGLLCNLCGVVAFLLVTGVLPAQEPYLVKDINPGAPDAFVLRNAGFTFFDGFVYFQAETDAEGVELWRSDGTAEGTTLVADIHSGAGDSSPEAFVVFNGLLYFRADDGVEGNELWRSDGTAGGTEQVLDLNPGSGDADPRGLIEFGGELIFSANDGNGEELWKTTGAIGNVTKISEINETTGSSLFVLEFGDEGQPSPVALRNFAILNGEFFFSASDGGEIKTELWKTDGTLSGTTLVADINPSGRSLPEFFGILNGEVIFLASDSFGDDRLFRTDGETVTPFATFGFVLLDDPDTRPVKLNDTFVFPADDDGGTGREAWVTDGTADGTMSLGDLSSLPIGSFPRGFTLFEGAVYFTVKGADLVWDLYKTDGTPGGTTLVKDFSPLGPGVSIADGRGSSQLRLPVVAGGQLFFHATTDAEGTELWQSDGTEAGTVLVRDLNPAEFTGSDPDQLGVANGRLFFDADEGNGLGEELYSILVSVADFANISTRGNVGTGDDVMIAGFIIEGGRKRAIVRAIGPGLDAFSVPNTLNDPMLQVFDGSTEIASNDDWRETQETEITESGLAPGFDVESAIILELDPGAYTAIVSGVGGTVGNARVDVIELE